MNKNNLKQDIRLGEIVDKLRKGPQPHLIVCDRNIGREFENIVTPEKQIPDNPLFIPWESCTTLGNKFSFHYNDSFKTGRHLALNLAPQPDGELPANAVNFLRNTGR